MRLVKTAAITTIVVGLWCVGLVNSEHRCSNSPKLQYLSGNALTDKHCLGPDGQPYPHKLVQSFAANSRRGRRGRSYSEGVQHADKTREELLLAHQRTREGKLPSIHSLSDSVGHRAIRSANGTGTGSESCVVGGSPPRLCRSSYNTTAPMYGVSLTSGQPVTIVQKFPDLLQQVIYETCDSKECDILHGECIQTYVPYLFLVIPLGPVTLTGQDYVLVESGCTCRPKYATPGSDPNPSDVIPSFN